MAILAFVAICTLFAEVAVAHGGHNHGPAIHLDCEISCWRFLFAGAMVALYFAILVMNCMSFYNELETDKKEKTVYKHQRFSVVESAKRCSTKDVMSAVSANAGLGA